MARLTPLHLIPALIAAASHASEVPVERRPFSIEKSFTATALPAAESLVLLKIKPQAWKEFTLVQLAPHGARVKKGELLAQFDTQDLDQKIEDTRRAIAAGKLSLAQAELELKTLQQTAPNKLESLRRAADIAKEENAYFTTTRRKAAEEIASQALKRSEQILSNQREELKQLSKMYEADDITENTEEIILVRQQDAVASAEFALRMEALDHKRTLEVTLPREAKLLADAERDTALTLKKAEADLPRAIEASQLALETLKTTQQRSIASLAELESDRAQCEIKAPADGFFYHGPIENGRWIPGELVKALIPSGQPPLHKPFATFVPNNTPFALIAHLDENSARSLATDLSGNATLTGREDLSLTVKLEKLASVPAPDGTYRADFSLKWPDEFPPSLGTTAQVRLISYQQSAAIVVPTKALNFAAQGWTIAVKMADGKTEQRPVQRGRASKDETEILSGLEVGQVIIIP
jgi:HlyD family secretion protein